MHSLRQLLGTVAARGIITVADTTSHIPSETNAAQLEPTQPLTSTTAPDRTEPPTSDVASPAPYIEAQNVPGMVSASATPVADWAATSITITISK